MARTIFYSWQSDLKPSHHRYFIEKCLKNALNELEHEAHIYMEFDRDTFGLNGSPDITQTIFDKIDKSVLFVCDISIVSSQGAKKTPNPNVLIELGYAVSKLGWEHIICLFDSNTGSIEDLPFDLRQKRITVFNPENPKEEKRITDILKQNIEELFVGGKLFNPLNDYMKGRIDKNILDVAKQIANFMFGTYTLSEGLLHTKDLLDLDYDAILNKLPTCEFPGFILMNTYETPESQLRDILKEILSSSYFPKSWSYTVLTLLDWLRQYNLLFSPRNKNSTIEENTERDFSNISVISASEFNKNNPINAKIVIENYIKDGKKYIDTKRGKVLNVIEYPSYPIELSKCFRIKESYYERIAKLISDFIEICKKWLDNTDSEFILDPDYYVIG